MHLWHSTPRLTQLAIQIRPRQERRMVTFCADLLTVIIKALHRAGADVVPVLHQSILVVLSVVLGKA